MYGTNNYPEIDKNIYFHLIYDRGDTALQCRNDAPSINRAGLMDIHVEKNESGVVSHIIYRNQFQMCYSSKCKR